MPSRKQTEATLQPGMKLAAAAAVLLVGLGVALLFRHESSEGEHAAPPAREQLLLKPQQRPDSLPSLAWPPGARSPGDQPSGPRPTVLRPQTEDGAPPTPGHNPAESTPEATSRWGTSRGMSMEMLLPRHNPPEGPRTHRIVDGDSLPALAERYLGSADRYPELFEANREVLSSPDVLPIGTRLLIPVSPQRSSSPR